jgi:F0F1-type ATP synthase delta subunit
MERKHKVLLKYLARLTFEGAEEDFKERIRAIAAFLIQRYPRNAKAFLTQYERSLREVFAERYATVTYAGTFREQWLRDFLEAKHLTECHPEKEECPELLGGFKIRVGDTVWDCSLKGQLNALKETFTP